MKHAAFTIIESECSPVEVTIIDNDGPLSVTNDAVWVVEELVRMGRLKEGMYLWYYDSEGALDEILVKDGKFAGFRVGERGGA